MSIIPYGRQSIYEDDIDAVVSVLRSNFLTQGPVVPAFEKAIAGYSHAAYAIGVNSATSALHLACLALGIQRGDIVWTTPITFVASANCALYCGATIDFVDIDPQTYNLCIEALSEKLEAAKKRGGLPKLVIPVHLCGQSCNMEAIFRLSQEYGFKIIEDASHAIGGLYKGMPIGNGQYSDITVFSFHPVKIITTGEGGMIVTNNSSLARQVQILRGHGISNLEVEMHSRPKDEIWNYQQIELGFNYRMNDIQAALGLSQLNRIDEFVKARRSLARIYDKELAELPIKIPWQNPDSYSSYHLYPIRIARESQRKVYDALHSGGVGVNLHYIPVYRQPYYESLGFKFGYCPEAERYFHETLSIPIFPGLKDFEQQKVTELLKKVLA